MNMKLMTCAALIGALAATPTHAEAGDWLLRLRGIWVAPNDSSSGIRPAFPGDRVGVTSAVMPEFDVTYFVAKHVGLELILATTKHDVNGKRGLSGLGEVADAWALPPTLTAQYHFAPDAKVRPYVGIGLNYTLFYGEDAGNALNAAIGRTKVTLDDSFGLALQAGVDVDVTETIFLNLDVKYIDMDTTARLQTGALVNTVDVSLDPIIVGVGIGMRF
ncbi:OmpW/AlkL family protein [Pedomonas mirosovicensis]|uniref:OmpW/AlkL family protein n=1 Tax=Pedomonas mirosovicensis TaxID=2908641 RepID=UPI00216972B7|nr:OmpW family protein [Pedomonas mirosovicensis]MCH8686251.1 OmpW family protein [Pedomonas mirosovicensis]